MRPIAFFLIMVAAAPQPDLPAQERDLIILDEQGVKNLQLELVEAQETRFEQSVFALGRIEVFPGNLSVVSSRIPGRAITVKAKAGMEVEEGEELLWVESRQPGDPPPTIRINAPRAGIVSSVSIAPGQPVSPDSSLMEIIDLSVVHPAARVPEHFASRLKEGQKAQIRVAGYPEETFEAALAHLGALVDPESGTLEVSFHLPNPDGLLIPGMRAEFSIVTSSRPGVMAVPREAVQGSGAERFVYMADYELKHAFEKIPVAVGEQNASMVEIVSGLFPGDQVVTRGSYALGFAGKGSVSLKEALDAAHGHPHAEDGSELTDAQAAGEPGDHGHGHAHGSGPGLDPLTHFFAGLSALLFVLLLLSLAFRKPGTA
ncbi:hypothetical protein BH23VER1_BH23VER1_00970 [soil metagenome]